MSDLEQGLTFVDPNESDDTYRVVLWAAPGEGKSVAAASAPGPILVVSADRPGAYRFARKHHADKTILETRYKGSQTLAEAYKFIRESVLGDDPIKTIVIDPIGNIIDALRDELPRVDGEPDYQGVNKKILGFIQGLRHFNVNVVLVAHEKLNDHKKFGDGKLYPAIGGGTLINKVLAEMDIAAHIERHVTHPEDGSDPVTRWIGQLQPVGNMVCKEATGALGDRRIADLTRWFEVATDALAPPAPDNSDLPFDPDAEIPKDKAQPADAAELAA